MHLRDNIPWVDFGIVKVSQLILRPMPSDSQNSPKTCPNLPSNWLLSFATAPVLLGLWGARVAGTWLKDLSEVSEEIWRGDRLPVLNFPTSEDEDAA